MAATRTAHLSVVVMGVAGCGKTEVGSKLAAELGLAFLEGDRLHPQANIERMRRGEPLTDGDREVWLDAIGGRMATIQAGGNGIVAACSALKHIYRDRLRSNVSDLEFIHLEIDVETALRRVAARADHFMPVSLVANQFQLLEQLGAAEAGFAIDGTLPVETIVSKSAARLSG